MNGIQEVSGSIPLSSTILTGQRPAKPFNEPAIRSGWRVFCCPPQAAAIRRRRWSRRGTGPELLSSLRGCASQRLSAPPSAWLSPAPARPFRANRPEEGKKLALTSLPGRANQIPFVHAPLTHIYHASKYKKPHQWGTHQKTFQWHYIWLFAASSGHFLHAAGGEWQAQGVVDFS